MSIFSDVMDFVGENSDIIKPIARFGFDAYSASQKDKQRESLQNEIKALEQRQYEDAMAQYDWYLQNQQAQAGEAGGGGANTAAGMAALGPALSGLDAYAQFGPQLMNRGAKQYNRGTKGLNQMAKFALGPDSMAAMKAPQGPAYDIGVPLPEWMKR